MGPSLLEILKAQEASGAIELQFDGDLATLHIRHAAKRNAMSASMMVDLSEAVDMLEGWAGSLLLVKGEGGHFCAGADLRLVQGPLASVESGTAMSVWMTALLNRIRTAPYLSVSLIEGVAMGGGAELATATDFRLISTEARFQFVQAARGVSPGWGGAARLVEIVGRTKALHVLTSATPITAETAIAMGLADATFDPGKAMATFQAFTQPMLEHAPEALRACKKAVVGACREGLSSDGELQAFGSVWGQDSQRRAMANALKVGST